MATVDPAKNSSESQEDEEEVDPIAVVQKVVIVITLLFILIGIVGNCLLIKKYLTTRNLNLLFPCLIVYLAIFDIVYLICTGVYDIGILAGLGNLIGSLTLMCLMEFAGSGSIFTTIVLAIERYLVLCQSV